MIVDLLQIPLTDSSVYNELASDGVTPRAHWTPFLQSLQAIDSDELARRWQQPRVARFQERDRHQQRVGADAAALQIGGGGKHAAAEAI